MPTLATLTTREILHDFCPDSGSTYMDLPVKPTVEAPPPCNSGSPPDYPHHHRDTVQGWDNLTNPGNYSKCSI